MGVKKTYLLLYNAASCVGWAFILFLSLQSLVSDVIPKSNILAFWNLVGTPLKIVQTFALLELVHSLLGMVPSPFFSSLVQVSSRIILVWVFANQFEEAQSSFGLVLMVLSWATVEVPRYAFYALNIIGSVPAPLLWMRYSLFSVLYPSGISGEVWCMLVALPSLQRSSLVGWYGCIFGLLLYIPGGLFMYNHMIIQRRRALSKNKEGVKKLRGIQWPKDAKGERSSTEVNRQAFLVAVKAIGIPESNGLATQIERAKNWRSRYAGFVAKYVRTCSNAADPARVIASAAAGLDYLRRTFTYIYADGREVPLEEALKAPVTGGHFQTYKISGEGSDSEVRKVKVPYQLFKDPRERFHGKDLTDGELRAQITEWRKKGVIEADTAGALFCVNGKAQEWFPLKNKIFVLLGAGSAMGPLKFLLDHGATVVAVDIPRPGLWARLIELARGAPRGSSLILPLQKGWTSFQNDQAIANGAGCNMMEQLLEVRDWLLEVVDAPCIVGGYAYLDGALHVQVSLAMDSLMQALTDARQAGLAFLCTPTDCHFSNKEAKAAAEENFRKAPAWQHWWGKLSRNFCVPNFQGLTAADDYIVDGIVPPQGPNYILAKRLQHWRAMVARSQGRIVSSNIAPSTATISVMSNKQFAAAYGGMSSFYPMEVLYQETSNAVMGMLLVHDVMNPESPAHPDVPLKNPLELFARNAFHGGIWRCGFKMGSIGEASVLVYYRRLYLSYLLTCGTLVAVFIGIMASGKIPPPHKW